MYVQYNYQKCCNTGNDNQGELLLLTGWLLFARQPTAFASPFAQDATPTPAEEEHTHSHEEAASVMTDTAASDESAEPTLHDLMHQIEALQAQVDELQAGTHAGHAEASANEVVTAIYLLDTAGLHALDDRLNQEKVINAGDSGNVARVAGLLASVARLYQNRWRSNATTLIDLLNSLSTALENDDVATAAPLSTQVHEAQHEFSHGVGALAGRYARPRRNAQRSWAGIPRDFGCLPARHGRSA